MRNTILGVVEMTCLFISGVGRLMMIDSSIVYMQDLMVVSETISDVMDEIAKKEYETCVPMHGFFFLLFLLIIAS